MLAYKAVIYADWLVTKDDKALTVLYRVAN